MVHTAKSKLKLSNIWEEPLESEGKMLRYTIKNMINKQKMMCRL